MEAQSGQIIFILRMHGLKSHMLPVGEQLDGAVSIRAKHACLALMQTFLYGSMWKLIAIAYPCTKDGNGRLNRVYPILG